MKFLFLREGEGFLRYALRVVLSAVRWLLLVVLGLMLTTNFLFMLLSGGGSRYYTPQLVIVNLVAIAPVLYWEYRAQVRSREARK